MTFNQSTSNRLMMLLGAPVADLFIAWLLLSDRLETVSGGSFTARFDSPLGRAVLVAIAAAITVLWIGRVARALSGRADLILDEQGIDAAGILWARRLAWRNVASIGRPVPWLKGMHQVKIQARDGRAIRLLTAYEGVTADELHDALVRAWQTATRSSPS